MPFRNDQQRRAAFAKMGKRPGKHFPTFHGFPTHGRGAIAQRNRVLAVSAALGLGGITLAGATGAGRRGPLRSVLGVTGQRNYSAGSRILPAAAGGYEFMPTFSSSRGASGGERMLGKLPLLRRLMGGTATAGVRGGAIHEVSGVPLATVVKVRAKAALLRRAEQASLWNILGKGRLLHAIESGSASAQRGAHRATAYALRPLARTLEHGFARRLEAGSKSLVRLNDRIAARIVGAGERLALHALKAKVG